MPAMLFSAWSSRARYAFIRTTQTWTPEVSCRQSSLTAQGIPDVKVKIRESRRIGYRYPSSRGSTVTCTYNQAAGRKLSRFLLLTIPPTGGSLKVSLKKEVVQK